MKRVIAAVLLLTGCTIFEPCIPTQVEVVRLDNGEVMEPNQLTRYANCKLISAEPYYDWVRYGLGASIETWECGCD